MPPPTGSILFVGSSVFRLWKGLAAQMAPLPVFNRAFGGSRTHEILAYLDRIILPYRPRLIVYYCGSNDINANVSPVQIAANFKEFVVRVQSQLPDTGSSLSRSTRHRKSKTDGPRSMRPTGWSVSTALPGRGCCMLTSIRLSLTRVENPEWNFTYQ
jgi:hypothetical protein